MICCFGASGGAAWNRALSANASRQRQIVTRRSDVKAKSDAWAYSAGFVWRARSDRLQASGTVARQT